jgi:hypothetical protein
MPAWNHLQLFSSCSSQVAPKSSDLDPNRPSYIETNVLSSNYSLYFDQLQSQSGSISRLSSPAAPSTREGAQLLGQRRFAPVKKWNDPNSSSGPSSGPSLVARGRTARSLETSSTMPIPQGCHASFDTTASVSDDDDTISMALVWPAALHCAGGSRMAVPTPLPLSLRYM